MKELETKILSFKNWEKPWSFYEFVCSEKNSNPKEVKLFIEIWTHASAFELWNNCEIILACKASQKFIMDNYDIDEGAVANIVRAISYEWR